MKIKLRGINLRSARKRIHHSCKVWVDKSVPRVTVWHHEASLVMPKCDPRDSFVYPYLTLMLDSSILTWSCDIGEISEKGNLIFVLSWLQDGDQIDILPAEGAQPTAPQKRITTPYMTKYERARVLGTRALQIA